MANADGVPSIREVSADALELEANVRAKLCSVVGDYFSLAALVSNWREVRAIFSENEAMKVEAAIRRQWGRS